MNSLNVACNIYIVRIRNEFNKVPSFFGIVLPSRTRESDPGSTNTYFDWIIVAFIKTCNLNIILDDFIKLGKVKDSIAKYSNLTQA